ncbi:MAG: prepilin-type N-terminal cleavage/methylation domain-containing protein [Planctomycetes bacterium]|nr:prepilin-type N-terminal cleavage/methylation domain-containing protein [Planctomycetota bacterium]
MNTRTRTRTDGLSLIEVVAAVAILAIALSYLLPVNEASRDRGFETRETLLAKLLAARKLEEVVQGVERGSGGADEETGLEWAKEEEEFRVMGERKVLRVTVSVQFEFPGGEEKRTVRHSTYAPDPKGREGPGGGRRP